MDLQIEPSIESSTLVSSPAAEVGRSKTALRMKYEAESEVIRQRIGDLNEVRQRLGLSQRKICQLLLVDPSAWTRWTSQGAQAPPHIYRALEWYLNLQEKHPAGEHALHTIPSKLSDLYYETQKLKQEIEALKEQKAEVQSTQALASAKSGSGSVVTWAVMFFVVAQTIVIICLLMKI